MPRPVAGICATPCFRPQVHIFRSRRPGWWYLVQGLFFGGHRSGFIRDLGVVGYMMFQMGLFPRLRCLVRTWGNLFAVVLFFLRNLLVVGNVTWVCHGVFSKNMRVRSSLEVLTLAGQSIHSARTPSTVEGKLQTTKFAGPTIQIQTCAVCGLPYAQSNNRRLWINLLGIQTTEVLMTDDNLKADVELALAPRMKAFHVNSLDAGRSVRHAYSAAVPPNRQRQKVNDSANLLHRADEFNGLHQSFAATSPMTPAAAHPSAARLRATAPGKPLAQRCMAWQNKLWAAA